MQIYFEKIFVRSLCFEKFSDGGVSILSLFLFVGRVRFPHFHIGVQNIISITARNFIFKKWKFSFTGIQILGQLLVFHIRFNIQQTSIEMKIRHHLYQKLYITFILWVIISMKMVVRHSKLLSKK